MKKTLSAIALAIAAMSPQAATVKILGVFTVAADAALSNAGLSQAQFMSNIVTSFNSAVAQSSGSGFNVVSAGSRTTWFSVNSTAFTGASGPALDALSKSEGNLPTLLLRDQKKADIIVVFTSAGTTAACGFTDERNAANPKYAYSVVNISCDNAGGADAWKVYTRIATHEIGHHFRATHEGGLGSAQPFVLKVGSDHTTCGIYYGVMQAGTDKRMYDPGWNWGMARIDQSSVTPPPIVGMDLTSNTTAVTNALAKCPLSNYDNPGDRGENFTCTLNSCTTPSGTGLPFSCSVQVHSTLTIHSFSGDNTFVGSYNTSGNGAYFPNIVPYDCANEIHTSQFSNPYGTYDIFTGPNAGSYTFGDFNYFNAIDTMQNAAPTVANRHLTKISGKIGMLLD